MSFAVHRAFVGLGSNLADPAAQVRAGIAALGGIEATTIIACSSLYRSAPVGYTDQPDFINAVAALETGLSARRLLDALLAVEHLRGRRRSFRNAPRTLDLDLLLFDACAIDAPGLTVPHPRMHERAFVLLPLAEIAPAVEIPGRGAIATLVQSLDAGGVARIAA